MVRLRKKLQSERGASILLALLMLLVCMMVAGSVLAAAASNAGKARSNRVEQQKYLTVSSAIQLVADEIEQAMYTGQYKLYTWDENIGTDDDPDWVSYYHIEQIAGDYTCGHLNDQIPLQKELDEIFSRQFTGTGYTKLSGANVEGQSERTLTVTLPGGLTGYPYDTGTGPDAYKVSDTVTVQVVLDHATRHIMLTAWLGEPTSSDKDNIMSAELVAKVRKTDPSDPSITVLEDDNPLVTVSPPAGRSPEATVDAGATSTDGTTATMTWQLHWIKKGAA